MMMLEGFFFSFWGLGFRVLSLGPDRASERTIYAVIPVSTGN